MATTTLPRATPAYRSRLYEWLTTTDHKKIGILYLVNSLVFFFAGGILAMVVRLQLAQPKSDMQVGLERGVLQPGVHDARLVHAVPVHHPDPGRASGTTPSRSRSARRTWRSRASTPCRSGCCRWAGC